MCCWAEQSDKTLPFLLAGPWVWGFEKRALSLLDCSFHPCPFPSGTPRQQINSQFTVIFTFRTSGAATSFKALHSYSPDWSRLMSEISRYSSSLTKPWPSGKREMGRKTMENGYSGDRNIIQSESVKGRGKAREWGWESNKKIGATK